MAGQSQFVPAIMLNAVGKLHVHAAVDLDNLTCNIA